jgi:hypothetical protein
MKSLPSHSIILTLCVTVSAVISTDVEAGNHRSSGNHRSRFSQNSGGHNGNRQNFGNHFQNGGQFKKQIQSGHSQSQHGHPGNFGPSLKKHQPQFQVPHQNHKVMVNHDVFRKHGQHHNNNGHHNNHGGHLKHHQIFQKFGGHCTKELWCHTAPQKCHWWYNYCPQIQHCSTECAQIEVIYVPCYVNGTLLQNVRWYLGMSGMFLPGRGIGVESIQPGSPAEQVGLVPGNVIVAVNGIRLESPEALDQAVAQSGGILTLEVAVADDAPTQMVQLTLQRVAVASY